jgi:hypothetical protein
VVGRTTPADIGQGAVRSAVDADGVPGVDATAATATGCGQGLLRVRGLVGVDELVAALFDAGEVGVGVDVVDAVVEELRPIVGNDLVEVGDELRALVRNDEWAGVAALCQEDGFEVVEGLPVVRELADEGVGVEPEELALLVVILAALPVRPARVSSVDRQMRPDL